MKQTAPLTEVYAMPKAKWNLNTIYISERLQESLRPISRCALTTVVAPMGYGKTTAVEWYLAERARAEKISVIRISVYSANLAIFWRSVQDAFARAGFDLLRDYDCPSDAAGGGLLIEDLCHALAGERACYIFLDDFHLLTSRRAAWFLCALAARLPANVHLILASRDVFLSAAAIVRLGAKVYQIGVEQLRLNHTELAVYISRCGTELSDEQIESLLYYSEGWFSAVYLNLRMYSEHGVLADRSSDISSIFTAAMIDPLPEKQREFLAVMGLADEFTVEMAQDIMQTGDAAELLAALTGQNAFVRRLPDGVTYRFHHMMKECALRVFLTLPQERRNDCRRRFGAWYEQHRQYLHAMQAYDQCGDYHALLRVVQQDAGILLSSLDPKNVLDFLDECPEDTLKAHPAALLVLMRSMFNWRNIPRMLALRQLLLTAIDEDTQRSAEERGNLLGECDLIMHAEAAFMQGRFTDAHIALERAYAQIEGNGQENMALCCDFLARRLSLFTDIGQRAKLEKRRERLLAHHNVSWLNLWNAAAAYHHALLGSTDSIPEAYRRHRLFTVRTLAPGKPMIEMIENQVYLAQGEYAHVIGRSEGLLTQCEAMHYALVALHIRIQTAAAYEMLGKHGEARALLERALADAEPDGFALPFAENFRYLEPLLTERLQDGLTGRIVRLGGLAGQRRAAAERPAVLAALTERECAIVGLMTQRLSNREIAEKLYLSEGSVRQYVNQIYAKLCIEGEPRAKRKRLLELLEGAD